MVVIYPVQDSNPIGIVFGPSYVKFYDRSTQTITEIDFIDAQMMVLAGDAGLPPAMHDVQLFGYIWRALMTQDPNWQNLMDLSTSNIDYMAGSGEVDRANLAQVVIGPIVPDAAVDYWWEPSKFGKFGWFAWNKDTPEMPIQWINYDPCYFFSPYGNFQGFKYSLFQSTTALCASYSMLDVPFNVFQGETFNVPR